MPYDTKIKLNAVYHYQKAIKGYYLNLETFSKLDTSDKFYFVPKKTAWGIDPAENEIWLDYKSIEEQLKTNMREKQVPLCCQQYQGT